MLAQAPVLHTWQMAGAMQSAVALHCGWAGGVFVEPQVRVHAWLMQ